MKTERYSKKKRMKKLMMKEMMKQTTTMIAQIFLSLKTMNSINHWC
jgi:hypothetical protein